MIITAYRIFFPNIFILTLPTNDVFFEENRFELPEGCTLELDQYGQPAIYDPNGLKCMLCPTCDGKNAYLINANFNGMMVRKVLDDAPYHRSLKELRVMAQLTQQQLADRAEINIRQYQKMESGEYKLENITAKNLLALADTLGVDPHYLIGG